MVWVGTASFRGMVQSWWSSYFCDNAKSQKYSHSCFVRVWKEEPQVVEDLFERQWGRLLESYDRVYLARLAAWQKKEIKEHWKRDSLVNKPEIILRSLRDNVVQCQGRCPSISCAHTRPHSLTCAWKDLEYREKTRKRKLRQIASEKGSECHLLTSEWWPFYLTLELFMRTPFFTGDLKILSLYRFSFPGEPRGFDVPTHLWVSR